MVAHFQVVAAGQNVHDAKLFGRLWSGCRRESQLSNCWSKYLCLDITTTDEPERRWENTSTLHTFVGLVKRSLDATATETPPGSQMGRWANIGWLSKCRAIFARYDKRLSANYSGPIKLSLCCSGDAVTAYWRMKFRKFAFANGTRSAWYHQPNSPVSSIKPDRSSAHFANWANFWIYCKHQHRCCTVWSHLRATINSH